MVKLSTLQAQEKRSKRFLVGVIKEKSIISITDGHFSIYQNFKSGHGHKYLQMFQTLYRNNKSQH